ncbi:MAG TPA: phage tail assembly protein [Candidatus Binataceae bacterium]|nr:phage tail assembly protein [Candidatus Binataceae bacterium]
MAPELRKTVTLSDGRIATVRRSKGGDLIHAQEIGGSNRIKFTCALLARITEIDGRPVVFEDVKELYASDIDRLSTEASGDFLSSTEKPSPASSNGDSPSPS